MNICFITCGVLPVPAVDGGAVENLVQAVLDKNEQHKQLKITVLSIHTNKAEQASKLYKESDFVFIKSHSFINLLDKLLFFVVQFFFKKRDVFSFRCIFRRLYFINQCRKYLHKHQFDKIILENHHSLFLIFKDKKLRQKIYNKTYYHAHNQPNGNFGCHNEIINCPYYIVVSNFIRNEYQKYAGIKSEFLMLKNGINTNLFDQNIEKENRLQIRQKYRLSQNDFVILFTGRLSKEKGILELAKAFSQLNNPNVKLMIAGSSFFNTNVKSPLNNQLNEILKNCIDRIIFTGYVPYNTIWELYHISDAGCFPSICDEGAGLTIIEAMVSGLPVITTNSGGIVEYATSECAFLLERNDDLVNNIKTAIGTLIEEPVIAQKMGEIGKNIGKQYNLDNYYKNLKKILIA